MHDDEGPVEQSSRVPVSVRHKRDRTGKQRGIDPRFNDRFGHFNKELFVKSYSWVDELRMQKIETLKQEIREEKDLKLREELKLELKRRISIMKTKENKDEKERLLKERKKIEIDLVKQGKKPFYPKNIDKNKLVLTKRYNEIKESTGGNETQMEAETNRIVEKRLKKHAKKERRHIPHRNIK